MTEPSDSAVCIQALLWIMWNTKILSLQLVSRAPVCCSGLNMIVYLMHIRTCDHSPVDRWCSSLNDVRSRADERRRALTSPGFISARSDSRAPVQSLSIPAWIQDSCLGIPTGVKDSPEEEHASGLPKKAFQSLFSPMWRKRYAWFSRLLTRMRCCIWSVCAQTKPII